MNMPSVFKRNAGNLALVDGIEFVLPVTSTRASAFMAVFEVKKGIARTMVPEELRLFTFRRKALLMVSVIDYRETSIGTYIEFSLGLMVSSPALKSGLLSKLAPQLSGIGQYVLDLPVSTEISVKGGKGIWGMPKHQASLDYIENKSMVSSRYDLDGQLVCQIDIVPPKVWLPLRQQAINYCGFRGMLYKSLVHFRGRAGVSIFGSACGGIKIGPHPKALFLKELNPAQSPLAVVYIPNMVGYLDDYIQSWFLSYKNSVTAKPEGLESVVKLGQSRKWPKPTGRF